MRKLKTQIQECVHIFSHITKTTLQNWTEMALLFSVTITNPQLTQENETTVLGFITMSFLPHVLFLNSLYLVAELKLHL